MGPLNSTRSQIRRAIRAGQGIDWVNEEIIDPADATPREKGALYLEAFAALSPADQQEVVRESFAMVGEQHASMN